MPKVLSGAPFSNRTGTNNWITFTVDSNISGVSATHVTLTGDATLVRVRQSGTRLFWVQFSLVAADRQAGNISIEIGAQTTTPNLDATQTFTVSWVGAVFGAVTEDTGPPPLPTPTISPADTSLANGGTTTVTVTFPSEPGGTFDENSVTLSAGSISGFTGSGTDYSFTLTAPSSGTGTINIDIPATEDWGAATRATVNYAPTPPPALPKPTISPVSTSLENDGTTTVNVTFPSTPSTTFAANNVTLSAGSISGFTGSGRNYSFTLTAPSSGTGTINIDIAGTSSWEAATRATVSYAPATPARRVTITPTDTSIQRGDSTTVRITFSGTGTVNGFTNSDITVSAGTKSGFGRSGNTGRVFQFTLTAPSSGTGTITIRVPANAISNTEGNAAASATVAYTAPPIRPQPGTLSIENIDEQFITAGTKGYRLIVDIGGNPDRASVRGLTEGFYQHWDNSQKQLHILAEEATRLINNVVWDIEAVKGRETLDGQIKYNVVKAAPIFQQLPTIYLYRGVDLNFDVLITNIPDALIPESLLVSLKSELEDYGLNFKGHIPRTANYPVTRDTLRILVPDETGETSTMHDYAYVIQSGSPPQIQSPIFTPKGTYGELSFDDLNPNHALGFEWTLDDGPEAEAEWNLIDPLRPVINPSTVEVTPGNLDVTIKFRHISNAQTYEYQLVSEDREGLWQSFTGTLANGFITTIIPNLEEGVTYNLRLRVASPWIGTPVSIRVTGGRVFYTLQINTRDRTQHYLYIFSNGFADNALATRIKRLLLPTSLSNPDEGGLAVNSDGDVFILNLVDGAGNEKAVYVFNASTIEQTADGARLRQDRKHPFPSAAYSSSSNILRSRHLAEYNNELYMFFIRGTTLTWDRNIHVFPIPTTDGVALVSNRSARYQSAGFQGSFDLTGFSVTDENIWYPYFSRSGGIPHRGFARIDRSLFTQNVIPTYRRAYSRAGTGMVNTGAGLKVIGESFYTVHYRGNPRVWTLNLFQVNPEHSVPGDSVSLVKEIVLPAGITLPRFLDMRM